MPTLHEHREQLQYKLQRTIQQRDQLATEAERIRGALILLEQLVEDEETAQPPAVTIPEGQEIPVDSSDLMH